MGGRATGGGEDGNSEDRGGGNGEGPNSPIAAGANSSSSPRISS